MAKAPKTFSEIVEEHKRRESVRVAEEDADVKAKTEAIPLRTLREIINKRRDIPEPGPEHSDASIEYARQLHLKEGVRKFGKKYDFARQAAMKKATDELAQQAYEASQKRELKTPDDMAATDEFKKRNLTSSGQVLPTSTADKVTSKMLSGATALGAVFDASHRYAVRAPGWYAARLFGDKPITWETAKELSKNGWSSDLMDAGLHWLPAHLLGIPLEAGTDWPLLLSGFGLGIKGMADAGDDIAELALKAGTRKTGSPAKLGMWLRNMSGKRTLHTLPFGKGMVGGKIADALKVGGKMFKASGEPSSGLYEIMRLQFGDEAASQAEFQINKAMRLAGGDELAKLKLSPEAMQRVGEACEWMGRARRGELEAVRTLDEITLGSADEKHGAELLRDMIDAKTEIVDSLHLGYADPTETILKRRKKLEHIVDGIAARAKRSSRSAHAAERKLSSAEQVLSKMDVRADRITKGIGDTIESKATVYDRMAFKKLKKAVLTPDTKAPNVSDIEQLGKTIVAKTELGSEEYSKAFAQAKLIFGEKTAKSKFKELPSLIKTHNQLVGASGAIDNAAVASTRNKIVEVLEDVYRSARTYSPDTGGVVAYESARASKELADISKQLKDIHKMHPSEWESAVRKTMSMKDYQGIMTPTQFSKITKSQLQLQQLQISKVKLTKRVEKLKGFANKKVAKANEFKDMEKFQHLTDVMRKLDEAALTSPDYYPRVTSVGRTRAVASVRAKASMNPDPLAKSSAGMSRQWITTLGKDKYNVFGHKSGQIPGRSMALNEIEADFRKATDLITKQTSGTKLGAADVKWLEKNDFIQDNLREMYGTTDINKAAKAAADVVEGGKQITGDLFELNPALAFPIHMNRITKDTQTKAMIEGLRQVTSDVRDAGHELAISQLHPRIRDVLGRKKTVPEILDTFRKTYPGMDLPQDVADAVAKQLPNKYNPEYIMRSLIKKFPALEAEFGTSGGKEAAEAMFGKIKALFPDKFVPKEAKEELIDWTTRLGKAQEWAAIEKNAGLHAYDAVQGLWKFQATGLWPSFHFRNATSDLMRALTNGPYNPVNVYRYGLSAVSRSTTKFKLGDLGMVSGAEMWDMAKAYGVLGGYFEDITGSTVSKWKKPLRVLSLGEDTRRAGYFAELIGQKMKPIQAKRLVLKTFFDYGNLAPWEKGLAKRVMPWWAFQRNNMKFQVEKLLSQPYWSAAQMRLMRGRRDVEAEMPEWYPDRLKGSAGIVIHEKGITSLLYGIDMGGGEDLISLLDTSGHPKGSFKKFLENAIENVSPVITGGVKAGANYLSGRNDALTEAPAGAEYLIDPVKDYFEITKEIKSVGGVPVETWMMPVGAYQTARSIRAFSEMMKFARYDNTKTWNENVAASSLHFLTGIRKVDISTAKINVMRYSERLESLQQHGLKNHMLDTHMNPLGKHKYTQFGLEYKQARQRLQFANRIYEAEERARRFKTEVKPNVQD